MITLRVPALALIGAAACLLILPALPQSPASLHTASDLGKSLLSAGLDPTQCYRIRDVILTREDARFYLTDGYLIFGKPVNGAPVSAVFIADTEGDDGELLMLPADRSERRSLAVYAGAPTLDEHFTNALFVFTGAGDRALINDIKQRPGVRNAPDIGALMAERWNPRLSAAVAGLEPRLLLDLLASPDARGFFEAFVIGRKLGSFELSYEPRSSEQLTTGQVVTRDGNAWWNTWTSFTSRSHRNSPPPEPEMRILSYRIEATLDVSLNLRCVTRVRIQTRDASRTVIPFDLSVQMRATSAKIDGEPAEVYQREPVTGGVVNGPGDELVLVIPQHPLAPGSEHEIEIHHEGRVVSNRGNGVYFVGARGVWYPNRGAQFATYDVTWRYPKNLELVSAGQVKEDGVEADQRVTRTVPSGAIRLLAFNLGQYDRKQIERAGFTVEVVANREIEDALRSRQPDALGAQTSPFPRTGRGRGPQTLDASAATINLPDPSPSGQLEHVAQDVADAMDFYRARFGPPPLNRLEVSPVPGRFGQGFAGMLYLSTLSYLPVTARPLSLMTQYEQAFYSELLRAHETAHQWWGNIVTSESYHHEWLLEALANYSALLFLESHKGQKFTDGVLDAYRTQLLAKGPDGDETESEGPLVQGRRLESSNNPNAWNAVAYGKGTWVLHMLRRRLGDTQFTKMLAELRRRYEFKDITTENFRALCAEFLPPGSPNNKLPDPKLEDFFDIWVYGTGIPGIKMNYSVKGKPGAYELTATVTQTDVPDDFSVLIPVEIQTGRGKVVKEIRTSSDPVTITVPVAIQTAKAVLDPSMSVLRR